MQLEGMFMSIKDENKTLWEENTLEGYKFEHRGSQCVEYREKITVKDNQIQQLQQQLVSEKRFISEKQPFEL